MPISGRLPKKDSFTEFGIYLARVPTWTTFNVMLTQVETNATQRLSMKPLITAAQMLHRHSSKQGPT